jgi:hypothetical protein
VIQEFYALLLAYFIIRSVMYHSAQLYQVTPQHLSFINALRLIQHTLPITQLLGMDCLLELFDQWQFYFRLPPRDNRLNPRVVKRKRDKFRRKRLDDCSRRVPPFAEVVRLL